jgi:hypothetical protein
VGLKKFPYLKSHSEILYFSFQQKENTMTFSSGGQEQTFSSASDSKFQETTATKTQQSTNFSSSEFTGNILISVL